MVVRLLHSASIVTSACEVVKARFLNEARGRSEREVEVHTTILTKREGKALKFPSQKAKTHDVNANQGPTIQVGDLVGTALYTRHKVGIHYGARRRRSTEGHADDTYRARSNEPQTQMVEMLTV